MVQITYIEDNGNATTVELAEGWNLMQGATANGRPAGIRVPGVPLTAPLDASW